MDIPLENLAYNMSKDTNVPFFSTIAYIAIAAAEAEAITGLQKEITIIQNQWHELQKKIVDDPMFVKHSEKLKEIFANAKSSLLNFISTYLENNTTLGATESSPAPHNQEKVLQKVKATSKVHVEILDKEVTADQDHIAYFLFENPTGNINV